MRSSFAFNSLEIPKSDLPKRIEVVSKVGRVKSHPDILRESDLLILEMDGIKVFVRDAAD